MENLSRRRDLDVVGPGGPFDDDRIGLPSPVPLPGVPQIDVALDDAGAGQVVDSDGVGTAEGYDVDLLDSLMSMVTVPTSRVNRSPWPLAERSMFSLTLAPLNCNVSWPPWPSTVSLPSPGFQTKVSSPAPRKAMSLPRPPLMMSLPSPPIEHVVAVATGQGVVARAAVHGDLD